MRTSVGFKWLFEGCVVKASLYLVKGEPKSTRAFIAKENISMDELEKLKIFIEEMKPITALGSCVQYLSNDILYTVYF